MLLAQLAEHTIVCLLLVLVTHGKCADLSDLNPDYRCFERLGPEAKSSVEDCDTTSEL